MVVKRELQELHWVYPQLWLSILERVFRVSVGPTRCLLWPVLGWSDSTIHCACVPASASGMLESCLFKSLQIACKSLNCLPVHDTKCCWELSNLSSVSQHSLRAEEPGGTQCSVGLFCFAALALTFAVATSCNYISWELLKLSLSWRWK